MRVKKLRHDFYVIEMSKHGVDGFLDIDGDFTESFDPIMCRFYRPETAISTAENYVDDTIPDIKTGEVIWESEDN